MDYKNDDFENDEMDFEDIIKDPIMEELKREILEGKLDGTYVARVDKARKMENVLNVIHKLAELISADITDEGVSPSEGCGITIEIDGECFRDEEIALLKDAVNNSDAVEIYPTETGKIKIAFSVFEVWEKQ